ncbi:MAG: ATP-dependent sacrificial sulfur transferase LarE [Methanoregulaceae archaeon]|nr:ATP-dependent sacrificial sulfur transferase LarE [Methanoregulaceae archaeon]
MDLEKKRKLVEEMIGEDGPVLISYSGGVDSSLLAVLASRISPGRVRCILLDSPVVPRRAIAEAQKIAKDHCFSCEIVPFPVLENGEFRKNSPDRCYFCKKASARVLKDQASVTGAVIVDGVNTSDLGQHRPGIRASGEEGICHPFIRAGISKDEIRGIARECGLSFWDKPSAACLSSRIPYGEEITEEKLRRVEEAEDFLAGLGFPQVRVRSHGDIARIEVDQQEMAHLFDRREEIATRLKEIGFTYVTMDLGGFRSGSMDEVL